MTMAVTTKLRDWRYATEIARSSGGPFTPGLISPEALHPFDARRGLIRAAASELAGGDAITVTYARGSSYADLRQRRINIDGELLYRTGDRDTAELPPGIPTRMDLWNEVLTGVTAHEAAHLRYTAPTPERRRSLRFFVNLLEDERIERQLVADEPGFAGPLATARASLITADGLSGPYAAVFLLTRAPHLLSWRVARKHADLLVAAIEILTPFPATHAEVRRAAAEILALLPPADRINVPAYPEFGHLPDDEERPRSGPPGSFGSGADDLEHEEPAVEFVAVEAAPAGYAEYRASTAKLTRDFVAALDPPPSHGMQISNRGRLDGKRAWRHPIRDDLFRQTVSASGSLDLLLIVDVSGSMRGDRWGAVHRISVALFEAAQRLPGTRLYAYGHGADRETRPSTQIYPLVDPSHTSGATTCLASLPQGANNRDGQALRVIGREYLRRAGPARGRRLVFHLCDGSPAAAGYGGQPALESTREALAWFRKHVAPIGQIGIEPEQKLELFGAPHIVWDEARAVSGLRSLLRQMGRSPQRSSAHARR